MSKRLSDRLTRSQSTLLAAATLMLAILFFTACVGANPQPTLAPTVPPPQVAISSQGAAPTVAPSPTPSPIPTRAAPSPTPTARPTPSALDAVLERVSAVRGLSTKEPVKSAFLPREQLRAYLVAKLEKERAREEIESEKGLYVALGLVEPDDDLYEIYLGLLTEQILGFYEFEGKELKVIGSGAGPMSTLDEVTLAHEYVHALQDQHFRLGARSKEIEKSAEASLALQALAEGDATLAMSAYARQYKSPSQIAEMQAQAVGADQQQLAAAPEIVQVNTLFPYTQGAAFVAHLVNVGGWAAVNQAYLAPPTTTEQILHPEKYVRGERPERVVTPELATALGPRWKQIDVDTLGELGWIMYLSTGLTPEQAGRAAGGWGGDEYVVVRNESGRYALAALTTWDSAADSQEFYAALRGLWTAENAGKVTVQGDQTVWAGTNTRGIATLRGHKVLVILAPDETTATLIQTRFGAF